jgi:hypothetical protein
MPLMATHKSDYHRERERREQTARKVAQEESRSSDDAVMEQCVIAYAAHIQDCGLTGFMRWEYFRADWYRQRGIMEERRIGR